MRGGNKFSGTKRLGLPFMLMPGFVLYLMLLALSLVFTQALKSQVSGVLYVFLLLLPEADFIILLISFFCVKVPNTAVKTVARKNEPVFAYFEINNRGLLPVSVAEAVIAVIDSSSGGCSLEYAAITLPPFGKYTVKTKSQFRFKGKYTTGVLEIYIYDFFRIFRIKKKVGVFSEIFILPDNPPPIDILPRSDGNETDLSKRFGSESQNEYDDLRLYYPGDGIKSVHWKLSTKTDDLLVKQYIPDAGRRTLVICDFGGNYKNFEYPDYAADYASDKVAGEAVAAAGESLSFGASCSVIWENRGISVGVTREDVLDPSDIGKLMFSLTDTERTSGGVSKDLFHHAAPGMSALLIAPFTGIGQAEGFQAAAAELKGLPFTVCAVDLSPLLEAEDAENYKRELKECRRLLYSRKISFIGVNREENYVL